MVVLLTTRFSGLSVVGLNCRFSPVLGAVVNDCLGRDVGFSIGVLVCGSLVVLGSRGFGCVTGETADFFLIGSELDGCRGFFGGSTTNLRRCISSRRFLAASSRSD